jgi:PAS domain S-box-containing protein
MNPKQLVRLLMIEDSAEDAELMVRALRIAGYEVAFARVDSEASLMAELERFSWDIVQVDYDLCGFPPVTALELVRQYDDAVPLVVVSGSIGEEMTAEVMRRGAVDVLRRENIGARLALVVQRELALAEMRRRAVHHESRFRDYAEAASDWFWEMDSDLGFTFLSERVREILGIKPEDYIGKTRGEGIDRIDIDPVAWENHLADLRERRPFRNFSYSFKRPDGKACHVRISGVPFFHSDGSFGGYRGAGTDITAEVETSLEARRLAALVRDSIEALSDGFALFDAEEQLIVSNSRFRQLYPWRHDLLSPGVRFENLVRDAVRRGRHPAASGNPEEWVAKRLAKFRTPTGEPMELLLADGRWFRFTDSRTGSGGTICLRTDVTDLKHMEQRLREAIESIPSGFALWDSEERFVLCNSRHRELYRSVNDIQMPGVRFEDLLRVAAERGQFRIEPETVEEWMARHLQRFRDASGPAEQQLSDGRWIRCSEHRTATGGTITLATDITDLKRVGQRLRDAIESIRDGFALWDPDDRLVLSNAAFRSMFAGIKGEGFVELMEPMLDRGFIKTNGDAEQWLTRRRQQAPPRTEPYVLEVEGDRWIEVRECRTGDGGIVTTFADVTRRRKTELALRESEKKFRSFLTASPDAMLVMDENGQVTLASARAEQLFGYPAAELVGISLEALIPERCRDRHAQHWDSYLRAPTVRQMGGGLEVQARRKDGSEFAAEVSLSPQRMAEGLVILAAVRDVTARKKAEDALRAAQKMEALGTLAGGIAHDLNNMLVPVLGLTQLVKARVEDDLAREYLDDVFASAIRGKELVKQILVFSRVETTEQTSLDLKEVVSTTMKLVRAALPPRINIVVACEADEPVWITGNETQLHQVIMNVCANAADAIGEAAGSIELALRKERIAGRNGSSRSLPPGEYAHLKITDDGPGMDEITRERAFEPFFTTKAVGERTGLGLSIVHGIVAAHHGIVQLHSQLGRGTRFEFYFPLVGKPEKAEMLPSTAIK